MFFVVGQTLYIFLLILYVVLTSTSCFKKVPCGVFNFFYVFSCVFISHAGVQGRQCPKKHSNKSAKPGKKTTAKQLNKDLNNVSFKMQIRKQKWL